VTALTGQRQVGAEPHVSTTSRQWPKHGGVTGEPLRVIALALLGFACVGAALLGDLSLPAKGGVALGYLALVLTYSFRARPELPKGIQLERERTPALFVCLDEVRQKLGTPRLQQVLLVCDFSAALVRRNTLVLGLPYLQAVTEQEFRAGIAREFVRGRGWLRRRDELAADRASAQLTSAEIAGSSLVAGELRRRFLEERFWPAIYARAEELPSPDPVDPFETLPGALKEICDEDAREWLTPRLQERLDALGVGGVEVQVPPPPEVSAAQSLLGKALPGLKARLAEIWRFEAAQWWHERYEYVAAARKRLGELAAAQQRSYAEGWELARLCEELEGGEAALPLYREMMEEDLEDARASFAMGRVLLAGGDETGLVYLDRAMELDAEAVETACRLAQGFLTRAGRESEARAYGERLT